MKGCELCGQPAKVFCDSDEASLCWDCDGKVHQANFLVAKHSRSLLCHVCQAPTPWSASGPRFRPIVSICEACAATYDGERGKFSERDDNHHVKIGDSEDDDDEDEFPDDQSDEAYDESDGEEDEEEDGENQVVPWSSTPPPPLESFSNSEDLPSTGPSPKCSLDHLEIDSEDNYYNGLSSPRLSRNAVSVAVDNQASRNDQEATSSSSFRPLKVRRRNEEAIQLPKIREGSEANAKAEEIIRSLKRFQHRTVREHTASE